MLLKRPKKMLKAEATNPPTSCCNRWSGLSRLGTPACSGKCCMQNARPKSQRSCKLMVSDVRQRIVSIAVTYSEYVDERIITTAISPNTTMPFQNSFIRLFWTLSQKILSHSFRQKLMNSWNNTKNSSTTNKHFAKCRSSPSKKKGFVIGQTPSNHLVIRMPWPASLSAVNPGTSTARSMPAQDRWTCSKRRLRTRATGTNPIKLNLKAFVSFLFCSSSLAVPLLPPSGWLVLLLGKSLCNGFLTGCGTPPMSTTLGPRSASLCRGLPPSFQCPLCTCSAPEGDT
mmetsp:Transcript_121649/g.351140  ORF Transcript_121649/g.351140 Transcript_121649/m.351140 type:complete len:285 (-) Transcript_121649:380-1234(-)